MKNKKRNSILQKIENNGLMLLLLLVPIQTRWIAYPGLIGGYSNNYLSLSIYVTDLLIVGLFIAYLARIHGQQDEGKISVSWLKISSPLFWWWFLFGVGCVSVVFANNHPLAIQRCAWIIIGGALAWLLRQNGSHIKQLQWFFSGIVLSSLIGIVQFFLQYAPENKWLGLASHDPAVGGSSVVEFTDTFGQHIRWLRAYGPLDHPNVFGVLMGVGIFFSLYLLVDKRGFFTKKDRAALYFGLLVVSIGMSMSLSRTAIGGFGLAIGTVCIVLHRRKQRIDFLGALKILLVPMILCLLVVVAYPQQFMVRSDARGRLEEKSLNERQVALSEGVLIIRENPFRGVGAGNYLEKLITIKPGFATWIYQPVHNTFLLLWAELGIFGILAGIGLVVTLIVKIAKGSAFLLGVVVILVPAMLFDHWVYDLHGGILIFACVAALSLGKMHQQQTQ